MVQCPKVEFLEEQKGHETCAMVLDFVLNEDCDEVLYQNYLRNKKKEFEFKNHIMRRWRFFYRSALNRAKRLIGKPV